ncbi:MAG: VTT domain-containing protein [Casimicrobiaceae bacterium]
MAQDSRVIATPAGLARPEAGGDRKPSPGARTEAGRLLVPGRNCRRIAHAARVGFLVDGSEYFTAVRAALAGAQREILILGWDIDSRMRLVPTGASDGLPEPLSEFLNALVEARPQLQVYVLSWDYALLFALEREWLGRLKFGWRTGRRLHVEFDDHHPTGASHHQKLVVVDDALAFVTGFDLTRNRWDTPRHLAADPARRNADGGAYAPFHDVGALVDGDAARALGEIARERWHRATGRRARAPEAEPQPVAWPRADVDLADVDVAIVRTEPAFDGVPAVGEVRQLHLDAIAAARSSIFAENQYFTSRLIADAFEARLAEPAGPEVVVVAPMRESGWLEVSTMGVLRARIHRRLMQADQRRRYRLYCPWLDDADAASPHCLNVHSKVLVIDDDILSIGSANLSARSMSLDTECNIAIEAGGDPRVRAAIAGLRARLLAEHLDREPSLVAATLQREGSLIGAIEALRGDGRSLRPLDVAAEDEWSAMLADQPMIDPEEPVDVDSLLSDVVARSERKPAAGRIVAIALVLFALSALALAWRYTPLREWINVDSLVRISDRFDASPFAPLIVIGGFVLGGLVVIPVTMLIAATGIVFGPWLGMLYSLAGATLSAVFVYAIGRELGRDAVRRVAGRRINDLSRRIAKRGLLAMLFVRIVPIAPFSIINLVAGASHLAFRDFVVGTILGIAPGTVVIVFFVDRIVAAVRHPGLLSFALLALVAGVAIAGTLAVRARLQPRDGVAATEPPSSRAD